MRFHDFVADILFALEHRRFLTARSERQTRLKHWTDVGQSSGPKKELLTADIGMPADTVDMDQTVGLDLFEKQLGGLINSVLLRVGHGVETRRHTFSVAFCDLTRRSWWLGHG